MKGLELARSFFEEYGLPLLREEFGECFSRVAAGLVGHGSECFGFDDEISTDHDFEPRFLIWLTDEDEQKYGFKMFRAYEDLPREYGGYSIQKKSAFGSRNKGVCTIRDFYSFYTGNGDVPLTKEDWLRIPDFYLAEATNGEVFLDNLGEFSRIREELKSSRPLDVRLKKMASAVFAMAQSGQYNYRRAYMHGQRTAAAVALADFARSAAEVAYLINDRYAPYYKWLFKGLDGLDVLSDIVADLDLLMSSPYDLDNNVRCVDGICAKVAAELRNAGLAKSADDYLEVYAYQITDIIRDGRLRNMPIML